MADQGFHPFSAMMSAPSTAQQHAGSSSSTAVIQVAALQSHTDHGNICLADDGYYWRMSEQNTIQGGLSPTTLVHYQCAQANCVAQKIVSHTAVVEILYRGSHNHPRQSDRLETNSQVHVLIEASDAAGAAVPSVPGTGNRDDQSSGSSDSDEDDVGDVEINGDAAAGDANAMQRNYKRNQPPTPTPEELSCKGSYQ
ncbi:hypothetical protein E2562_019944 [Oryza meyeriana var. granulata]|uniref:WRKY domain-containing protein n=1 Tax=Oryza meyeriana var. granulata TaxID=110450 RepID=A0A6G1CHB3_9ORYZ|nr:hypothetical protein E2562_019944 [Oryza meyeriana var. granulata]KAF0899442.1 hypothetical protein E2562_019944 [Oryza meyeriana var. granulata]